MTRGHGRLQRDPEVTGSRDCLDHLADHVVEDSAVSEVLEFHVRVKPGLHLERAAVTQLWRERQTEKDKKREREKREREKDKDIKRKIKTEREKIKRER